MQNLLAQEIQFLLEELRRAENSGGGVAFRLEGGGKYKKM